MFLFKKVLTVTVDAKNIFYNLVTVSSQLFDNSIQNFKHEVMTTI